jgi:hypothetical protein
MRAPLLLALICLSTTARAAADPPSLEESLAGKTFTAKQLVPRGLVKVAEAKGDLDGDGTDDVALIVHDDPKASKTPGGGAADPDIFSQSVLLFHGDKSGKYLLWKVGETHFVDSHPNFMEQDGFGVLQIKKGVLTIGSSEMMSSGSWSSSDCTLKWRNGPAGFQLIGLTTVEVDRSCACVSSSDTNLLTGLEIYSSNLSASGKQLKKDRVVKKRRKPEVVLWEDFEWEKMCVSN